jgi:hypothetical protein
MELAPDHESIVLKAARAIDDSDLRGEFFKHCADLLRPIRHVTLKEVYRCVAEAHRKILEL